MDKTTLSRFLAKVAPDEGGCWIWIGTTDRDGYGIFGEGTIVPGSVTRRAHRISYTHFVGAIPDGLVIDHLCRVHSCVNPNHLEPVTIKENLNRGIWNGPTGDAHWNAQKTHCVNGHEFIPRNVYFEPNPSSGRPKRKCRACRYARNRAYRLASRDS